VVNARVTHSPSVERPGSRTPRHVQRESPCPPSRAMYMCRSPSASTRHSRIRSSVPRELIRTRNDGEAAWSRRTRTDGRLSRRACSVRRRTTGMGCVVCGRRRRSSP
jgi:hypothetical protein